MLYLVSFRFKIFKHSSFLYDIIGKLLPFHIAITININLVEKVSQISDKRNITIGSVNLPELEMLFSSNNKLLKIELIIFSKEFLLE